MTHLETHHTMLSLRPHLDRTSSSLRTAPVALLLVALVLTALPAVAQQNIQGLPNISQKQSITQTVGISQITVAYHRPLVKDRPLYGALVPYGQVWRAGANDNTTITFSDPVEVEGQPLAAGTYGLHMLPGENEWQILFSTNSTSWGSFSYDEAEDALRVSVKPEQAPHQEILQYEFDHLTTEAGTVALHWGELRVPFRVAFDTNELVVAKLRNDLRHQPGFSWMGFATAANYCLANDINLDEAMTWADRALAIQENFSTLQVKAGLLDQAGQGEEAVALLERALEGANERQVNALGYQFIQRGMTEKAIEVFARNVADHPESWNVWDSLGEAQAAAGETRDAIANYEKALSLAPEAQKGRIEGLLAGLRGH